MRRIFILTVVLLLSQVISAQTNPIDEIFEKYSEKEGFTSIYISGKMLGMLGGMEAKSGNTDNLMLRLKSIRILTEDDSLSKTNVNFFTELSKKLDLSVYEELMVVREGQDVTKFLVRQNGDRISELLMISGGTNGNSLISIRGDMDLKEISQLSKTIGVEQLEQLEEIDKKQPGK
jgi:hypothetical protein